MLHREDHFIPDETGAPEHAQMTGDLASAFDVLYLPFFRRLVRYGIAKGLPDPENYAQKVLIRLNEKFDASREVFPQGLLWRLAHHMAIDERRKLRRRSEVELLDGFHQDRAMLQDESIIVTQVLDQLTSADREAIEMWLFELPVDGMAHEWNCTPAEATLRLGRAIDAALLASGGKWERLDDRAREAIAMKLSGVDYKNIAAAWQLSEGAVKMRIFRATEKLRNG